MTPAPVRQVGVARVRVVVADDEPLARDRADRLDDAVACMKRPMPTGNSTSMKLLPPSCSMSIE